MSGSIPTHPRVFSRCEQGTLPLYFTICIFVGRDSSVDIVTRYGLDGPGIESRWKRDFPQRSRPD